VIVDFDITAKTFGLKTSRILVKMHLGRNHLSLRFERGKDGILARMGFWQGKKSGKERILAKSNSRHDIFHKGEKRNHHLNSA
jgi:hypothetical protein